MVCPRLDMRHHRTLVRSAVLVHGAACILVAAAAACSGSDSVAINPPLGGGDAAGEAGGGDAAIDDGGTGRSGGDGDATRGDASTDAAVTTAPVSVTVDRSTTRGVVVEGFAGLSYEKAHLRDHFFSAANVPLVALFKLLGPGVLRVGGNTVDTTVWTPDGIDGGPDADAGAPLAITKADVDELAAFARAARWKVIYGVNMKTSSADKAAAEATHAASVLGERLAGFEIGNECDLYKGTTVETTWWLRAVQGTMGVVCRCDPSRGTESAAHRSRVGVERHRLYRALRKRTKRHESAFSRSTTIEPTGSLLRRRSICSSRPIRISSRYSTTSRRQRPPTASRVAIAWPRRIRSTTAARAG